MKEVRLIALIEPSTMKALKLASKKQKVSVAELVRQAIAEYLRKQP